MLEYPSLCFHHRCEACTAANVVHPQPPVGNRLWGQSPHPLQLSLLRQAWDQLRSSSRLPGAQSLLELQFVTVIK